jgi:hypothetical protein
VLGPPWTRRVAFPLGTDFCSLGSSSVQWWIMRARLEVCCAMPHQKASVASIQVSSHCYLFPLVQE